MGEKNGTKIGTARSGQRRSGGSGKLNRVMISSRRGGMRGRTTTLGIVVLLVLVPVNQVQILMQNLVVGRNPNQVVISPNRLSCSKMVSTKCPPRVLIQEHRYNRILTRTQNMKSGMTIQPFTTVLQLN